MTQASIWHIFLAVFNTPHFASETEKFAVSASLRSAPLLREGVAGERTAGEKAKQKTRGAGHRTMRQGSKLMLFAANLRHGRKVRPCSRPSGAQGGVFGYSGGKGKIKGAPWDIEPCDKLRALRLSSAEFQRKFCPLSAPFGRAGWSVRVQQREKAKQKTRGDCLGLFVLAPPAGLEPATP